mmetsp:Transcript_24591/g.80385  ORF Transcript_24591/g.80385 Transcript_24591/m.80385 type:complete len:202 (-) Transcript_24591:55-660(-)
MSAGVVVSERGGASGAAAQGSVCERAPQGESPKLFHRVRQDGARPRARLGHEHGGGAGDGGRVVRVATGGEGMAARTPRTSQGGRSGVHPSGAPPAAAGRHDGQPGGQGARPARRDQHAHPRRRRRHRDARDDPNHALRTAQGDRVQAPDAGARRGHPRRPGGKRRGGAAPRRRSDGQPFQRTEPPQRRTRRRRQPRQDVV